MFFKEEDTNKIITDSDLECFDRSEWIGFDKHKKIIYGIQTDSLNRMYSDKNKRLIQQYEWKMLIKKLNLFTETVEIVKYLVFRCEKRRNPNYICRKSMNTKGDSIGMIVVIYEEPYSQYRRTIETIDLYIICIETGTVQIYALQNHEVGKNSIISVELVHSAMVGWVVKLAHLAQDADALVAHFRFYRVNLNDETKKFSLEFLTVFKNFYNFQNDYFTNSVCFEKSLVMIFDKNLHIFDFQNDRWSSRNLSEKINVADYVGFGLSIDNLFLVSNFGRDSLKFSRCTLKFDTDADVWRPFHFLRKTNSLLIYSHQTNFTGISATPDVIAVVVNIQRDEKSVDADEKLVENSIVYLKRFNVPSLKDWCFLKLYKKNNLADLLLPLPQSLIRQYFGPKWSIDNVKLSRTPTLPGNVANVSWL